MLVSSEVKLPSKIWQMEDALIACLDLWWRTPGDGQSPFSGDGPWHLAQGEAGDHAGNYSVTLIETPSGQQLAVRKYDSPRPRSALESHEVDWRDVVTGWTAMIADEADREIVKLAVKALWQGQGRVPWQQIKERTGCERSTRGIAWRYRRALAELVCKVNQWPLRRIASLSMADREV